MGALVKSFITKQAPITYSSRVGFLGPAQNKQTKESYLRYYSEIGWLRAAVSTIAQAIAQNKWRLYETNEDGDREEVTEKHELKQLLKRPNPFQSGYDFIKLHQIFYELLGEVYWIKQRNQGKSELWIAPPNFMTPIPDAKKYISGYKYERGDFIKYFQPNEVIPFLDTNPMDIMAGTGRAQAVGIDIESHSFMSQYNRNFFYWGADAGTVITYPVEASVTPEELDRLNEQWNAGHRSYGRAHRAAILTQGATIDKTSIGQKDMDFSNLSLNTRNSILGVFGVSYALVGGTEDVNRANAEAQLLNFARWVENPRLTLIREQLNMALTPDYGENLELDYEDPVPEDNAQSALIIDNHLKSGAISIEEARQELDLGDIEPEHHFIIPINMTIKTGDEILNPPPEPEIPPYVPGQPPIPPKPPEKSIKKQLDKEAFWKAQVRQAENYEPAAIRALNHMYGKQRKEALKNVKNAVDRNHKLIDVDKAKQTYSDSMTPVLADVILNAAKGGLELIEPDNPHKQDIPPVLNRRALEWLKTRIGWAAILISEETAKLLADILAEGFNAGESTDQIAKRIEAAFDEFSEIRSQRIARTEIMMASNEGALEGYKESGVVNKVEFYAALDERTCDVCMGMHGEVFPVDDFPMPPASTHPSCRCVGLPVIE